MNSWLKKNWHVAVILFSFLVITFIYFSPVLQGKKLSQSDVQQAMAGMQEIKDYTQDGKGPLWTNGMFGGMPSFQIWIQYPSNIASHFIDVWNKIFPNPTNFVLLYLLGGFFLFRMLRFKPWLCFFGAIAIAFSTYNFIIVEAGHTGKALAIAFFAPILGSIIMAFRGRRLWGAALLALLLALEIRSNHFQMTYYLMIGILIILLAEFISAIKEKTVVEFIKTGFALLAGVILAVGINAGSLWTTAEYAEETIRGKSDIVTAAAGKESQGLDKGYAYTWSEGVMESVTFLIPDAYGGGSGIPFGPKSEIYHTLLRNQIPETQAADFASQVGGAARYWGDKPFTSGPYYFGALSIFLFLLGLSVLKGSLKWGMALAALLSIMLSWGRNFQSFSDLFFDYFPLYHKFRAVESILVLAGLMIPVLAVMLLNHLFEGKINKEEVLKKLKYTAGGLGAFLLLFVAAPTLFLAFKSPNDAALAQQLQTMAGPALSQSLMTAIETDRIGVARMDAIRSLVFVLIAAGLIWALITEKVKAHYVAVALTLTLMVDLWGIDKRYANDSHFTPASIAKQSTAPREVDLEIRKDPDPYYRVYDMTGNPFANAAPSRFHKSIGGYHAAKLKRYQNLIDSQLVTGNPWVFNMLNTKYIITTDSTGQARYSRNEQALGNAWFVTGVRFADNANKELSALDDVNPATTAIIGADFRKDIDISKIDTDPDGTIKLTSYHPDKLVYESNSATHQLAVFSDIYYAKGWNAYVDGQPHTYFRTDFLLRGMQLEPGKHTIEFRFEPKAFFIGERISLASSILLVLGFIGLAFYERKKKPKTTAAMHKA